jgi:hypothetical protein
LDSLERLQKANKAHLIEYKNTPAARGFMASTVTLSEIGWLEIYDRQKQNKFKAF